MNKHGKGWKTEVELCLIQFYANKNIKEEEKIAKSSVSCDIYLWHKFYIQTKQPVF